MYRKGILFSIFWHFPPVNMLFQKDLKQESSQLVTGDIASCGRYHWKAHIHNWPIGIVFSKDASIPTWDISNLGVNCDEIAMTWIDSQVFNFFEVERNFLVPKCSGNPGNRYHEAQLMHNWMSSLVWTQYWCLLRTLNNQWSRYMVKEISWYQKAMVT